MIIALGMPMVGDVPAEIITSRIELGAKIGSRLDVEGLKVIACLDVFPFDRAREFLIEQAISAKVDYLLFLDADVIMPTDTFDKLYEELVNHGAQVANGHYRRRGHPYTCVWAKMSPKPGTIFQCDAADGVHTIDSSGLGCTLIDIGWCEEHLKHPWFKMGESLEEDNVWEDAYFHSQVGLAGGKIIGHAGVRCSHIVGRLSVCDENWKQLLQKSTQKQVDLENKKLEGVLT